jgi:hypothetical protein
VSLSRRGLMATLASSASVVALPAVVAAASPKSDWHLPTVVEQVADDPVIALAEEAVRLWHAHQDACTAFEPFEEKMIDWRKRNPIPERDTCWAKIDPIQLDPSLSGLLDSRERTIIGTLRTPKGLIANANETIEKDFQAGITKWLRRLRDAKRRCGFRAAEITTNKATRAVSDAIGVLEKTQPRTFAGLVAKAKAFHTIDPDGDHGHQLCDDILALGGEGADGA